MGSESAYNVDSGKKITATTREPTGAAFLLRCAELGLVADDILASYTMGMVYDMLTERSNDQVRYPEQATQDHYDSF